MFGWSIKRKLTYLGIIFGAIFIIVVIPFFISLYEKPTCFDGIRNQGELEADCGGSCERICNSQIIEPVVAWSRVFEVASGIYSAVAYVENPNINAKSDAIRYLFKLRDASGNILTEREGNTFMPDNRVVAIFEPNFRLEQTPVRADFEFIGDAIWKKDDMPTAEISVRSKRLSQEEEAPRLEVRLENKSLRNISRLEVVAIVLDGAGNAIGVSRTFVDNLERGKLADNIFTWPKPFVVEEKVCQLPVDIALIIDRSGSMAAENLDPPQPLTDVKEAARFFTEIVGKSDKVSIISFADEASKDSELTSDRDSIRQAIDSVSILFDEGTQYTNTSDSLSKALEELESPRHSRTAERVIVLLTDGERPNRPLTSSGVRDDEFASNLALQFSEEIKKLGIEIFTIGLGKQFDGSFLKTISTTPEHFYHAPSTQGLKSIYEGIATEICRESPTVIEIVTREVPSL